MRQICAEMADDARGKQKKQVINVSLQSQITDARRRMLEAIRLDARETAKWTGRVAFSQRVMDAMDCVPRHVFIEGREPYAAYANRPAPIGFGQTISQPYIVALMSDLLDLAGTERVLEIGTGCGYQSAVLAKLAAEVWSVEALEDLVHGAEKRLKELKVSNVFISQGDGFQGWLEQAPFDAIIVTAAPAFVPPRLIEQLKPGGVMVVPVGRPNAHQMLFRLVRSEDGGYDSQEILPVAFVPLIEKN